MAKCIFSTCIVLFFMLMHARAQEFRIRGSIQEAETKAAVQGATVLLQRKADTSVTETSFTDSAGRYQFSTLARDSFNLIISSIGFETLRRTVVIDSADVDLGVLLLPRSSKELTGVTVTAATPPAIQKGDTVQINASQYK